MEPALVARVRMTLFPGDVSGKTQGYRSNIRPNHHIPQLGYSVIGNVIFDEGGVELGGTGDATVTYLFHEPFSRVLVPGLIYEVREGNRIVGSAEVLAVDTPKT